jgi:hypothetical protein
MGCHVLFLQLSPFSESQLISIFKNAVCSDSDTFTSLKKFIIIVLYAASSTIDHSSMKDQSVTQSLVFDCIELSTKF